MFKFYFYVQNYLCSKLVNLDFKLSILSVKAWIALKTLSNFASNFCTVKQQIREQHCSWQKLRNAEIAVQGTTEFDQLLKKSVRFPAWSKQSKFMLHRTASLSIL